MEDTPEMLLSIIQLQQLYITALNNMKNREFFLASDQLEEAHTLFYNLIDEIKPISPRRDFIIQLRDLIIDNLKQINQYIYESDDIHVSTSPINELNDSNIELNYSQPYQPVEYPLPFNLY